MTSRKRTLAALFGKEDPSDSEKKKQKIVYDTAVTKTLEDETLDRSLEPSLTFDNAGRISVTRENLSVLYPPCDTSDPSGMREYLCGGDNETYVHEPNPKIETLEQRDWSWRFNFKKMADARNTDGRKIKIRMKNNFRELVPLYEFPLLSRLYGIGMKLKWKHLKKYIGKWLDLIGEVMIEDYDAGLEDMKDIPVLYRTLGSNICMIPQIEAYDHYQALVEEEDSVHPYVRNFSSSFFVTINTNINNEERLFALLKEGRNGNAFKGVSSVRRDLSKCLVQIISSWRTLHDSNFPFPYDAKGINRELYNPNSITEIRVLDSCDEVGKHDQNIHFHAKLCLNSIGLNDMYLSHMSANLRERIINELGIKTHTRVDYRNKDFDLAQYLAKGRTGSDDGHYDDCA